MRAGSTSPTAAVTLGRQLAEQDPVCELLRRERVLALARRGELRGVDPFEQCEHRAEHRDARTRSGDGVLAEGKLIELPQLLPARASERQQELERLDEVHRADGQVVIPTAEVVVEVNVDEVARG